MKISAHLKTLLLMLVLGMCVITASAQQDASTKSVEILSNADILLMAKSGLAKQINIRRTNKSNSDFDVKFEQVIDRCKS